MRVEVEREVGRERPLHRLAPQLPGRPAQHREHDALHLRHDPERRSSAVRYPRSTKVWPRGRPVASDSRIAARNWPSVILPARKRHAPSRSSSTVEAAKAMSPSTK